MRGVALCATPRLGHLQCIQERGEIMSEYWTEDKVKYLLDMNSLGMSAGKITIELTKTFEQPVSRNAVIGKIHRLTKTGLKSNTNAKRDPATSRPKHEQRKGAGRPKVQYRLPRNTAKPPPHSRPSKLLAGLGIVTPAKNPNEEPADLKTLEARLAEHVAANAFQVRFLDRKDDQCPAIGGERNEEGDIMVCGIGKARDAKWCDAHHHRFLGYTP